MSRKPFTPKPTKKEVLRLDDVPARDDQALVLPVSAILVKQNPRSDLGDLSELKHSILERGVLNPLLVAKVGDRWELLGGNRRLECAKQIGMTDVPCRLVTTEEP